MKTFPWCHNMAELSHKKDLLPIHLRLSKSYKLHFSAPRILDFWGTSSFNLDKVQGFNSWNTIDHSFSEPTFHWPTGGIFFTLGARMSLMIAQTDTIPWFSLSSVGRTVENSANFQACPSCWNFLECWACCPLHEHDSTRAHATKATVTRVSQTT